MAEWSAKRFWTQAEPVAVSEGYAIHLDGRPLNSPAKTPVVLPTLALARAVAEEWQAQGEKINPLSMPHTRSANAALDKVAPQRGEVARMIGDFAGTDLLCYRAAGPEALTALQAERWDPLLDWAAARCGGALRTTTGVMPVEQPAAVLDALRGEIDGMSVFDIAAFHDLVSLSGSFVIGLAVARGHLAPDEGWSRSRLDEDWQADQWGRDEEAEEKAALRRRAFLHAYHFMVLSNRPDTITNGD